MEMGQLKIFCAVAEKGSFTSAAHAVHTVQSNVTMRIKELESELRQQLFIRQKAGALLTPSGRTFLGFAQRILRLAEESRAALQETASPEGPLRLGSMETTAAIRLPKILTQFRTDYPQVQLSLLTGTSAELVKSVESYRLDGAFVGGFHQSKSLEQEQVFEEELVLLTSRTHNSLPALIKQLPQLTVLVFRAGCFYRSTLENWFYQAGIVPKEILELGTLDGIISCVAAGMGVALLPRSVVDGHGSRELIRCHRLPSEFGKVKTVFVRRKDSFASPALTALIGLVHRRFSPQIASAASA